MLIKLFRYRNNCEVLRKMVDEVHERLSKVPYRLASISVPAGIPDPTRYPRVGWG